MPLTICAMQVGTGGAELPPWSSTQLTQQVPPTRGTYGKDKRYVTRSNTCLHEGHMINKKTGKLLVGMCVQVYGGTGPVCGTFSDGVPHFEELQMLNREGTFARRAPGAPGIQINVPVVHPHALPLDITPSSSPGTLSTNDTTKHNCK